MAAVNKPKANRPNYKADEEACRKFMKDYTENGTRKYWDMLTEVTKRTRQVVEIDLADLLSHTHDEPLVKRIEENTRRYVNVFQKAIDHEDMPQVDWNDDNVDIWQPTDIMLRARLKMRNQLEDPDEVPENAQNVGIPAELKRKYQIRVTPRSQVKTTPIRLIQASQIGSLLQVSGIVTRITEVRPMLRVATFTCDFCGNENYQIVHGRNYTPVTECRSVACVTNKNKRPIYLQHGGSKFVKFQEMKLQELPENVPEGATPRAITVYLFGENTRLLSCGDKVTLSGIWLTIPRSGFREMKGGLTANTYLEAMTITKKKKGYDIAHQSQQLMEEVERYAYSDRNIYNKLARSIAPEIFGMEDVKKALLLLMVAGVTKDHGDGLRIRGDINLLLMGDPGVAKSQLLKHVSRIVPRCIYTTGKGSSGVGLTAAVIRDPVTSDVSLEAGALVLADKGICCIDEFDKMEESDRTAIHEVMEQQTVSIAKAGITTKLNARTAVLAAANPAYGRYNKKKTPEENINLAAALLSRFDLTWVLVDKPDHDNDLALARHISYVHQHNNHPALDFEPFSPAFMRAYVAKARSFEPLMLPELAEFMVGSYIQMRQECLGDDGCYDSKKIVMTPRGLLSILRLSQALARIEFRDEVSQADIEEAIRLMTVAKQSCKTEEDMETGQRDAISKIYDAIINHMMAQQKDEVELSKLEELLTVRGFTTEQINDTISRYDGINVWQLSRDQSTLRLV